MRTFVALLRGINVGGNNMISMKALKASFERLGFKSVSTYINSGNVLFQTRQADARKLEVKIEKILAAEYQLGCKVVVRSAEEIATLVKKLPKHWTGDKDWRYNVIFLRHTIDSKEIVKDLNANPEIEQVIYVPGTLLWSAHVKDVARTTMVKASHKLYLETTVRNLNTTRKLHQLMQEMCSATPGDT